MSEPAARPMTLEELLDWAERQEIPYELVDGRPVPKYPDDGTPFAIAGGSFDHHTIMGNCSSLIRARQPPGCRVAPDARVAIAEQRTRIPDVVMSCRSHDKGAPLALDPVLILEVLSPTTINIDKGERLDDYESLASVREIWLVDSTRRRVTVLRRVPEGWLMTDHIGTSGFRSEVLGCEVELDELYADTPV